MTTTLQNALKEGNLNIPSKRQEYLEVIDRVVAWTLQKSIDSGSKVYTRALREDFATRAELNERNHFIKKLKRKIKAQRRTIKQLARALEK